MTLLLEAAPAAIFLPQNELLKEKSTPMLMVPKPTAPEYICGDIAAQFERLQDSQTIAEEYAALNAIILLCGRPIIRDIQYQKFFKSGPHHRTAPIFQQLGFPHTLQGDVLTSLLVKVESAPKWQFVFNPAEREATVFDSVTGGSPSKSMNLQLHKAGSQFEFLKTAVEEAIWPKFVHTPAGMVLKLS